MDKQLAMRNIIIVRGGSDAGGWRIVIGPGGKVKIERIPGWNPEGVRELAKAIDIIGAAASLKTPRVGEEIVRNALEVVQKEAANFVPEGSMLIVHG